MDGWRKARFALSGRRRAGRRRGPLAAETLEPRRLLISGYLPLNLASDQSTTALVQDANLVNPWGQALNANGGDVWVADRGTGVASLYLGAVGGSPFLADTLAVSIPGADPTGVTTNGTTSFVVQSGAASGPASFLFSSAGGNITGWNQGVPPPSPSNQAQIGASTVGAIFTGLALANNAGQNFLYAADFHNNRIDVFNSSFQPVSTTGGFTDPNLPAGFAPYNIVNLGGQLLVCYAKQDASGQSAVAGPGNGALDLFDPNGVLESELVVGQSLNAPWGVALAPFNFGDYPGALLVANSGNGQIEAFNSLSGAFLGTLSLPSGVAITIDGLHGLSFGNGLTFGNSDDLFFSAGTDAGQHGLFGAIQSAQGVFLVAEGTALTATANVSFNGTLAVFSDAQNLPTNSFSATINWGDGTVTPGVISALTQGGFAVNGTHTYVSSGLKSISIQVFDPSQHSATANALARVAATGLTMTSQTITPTEGAAFSGTVATFADGDGNTSTAAYTATILWGDGTTTPGTLSFSAGEFSVVGSHTYSEEGTDSMVVKVNDLDGALASVACTASVADAPLNGSPASVHVPSGGVLSNMLLATFTDQGGAEPTQNYTATINWGDGTSPSAGSIVQAGTLFQITGSHTYQQSGNDTVQITVKDEGGSTAIVDVQVFNPPPPDQLYVEAVYEDVLARPADPTGLAYWTQQLEAGQPRTAFVGSLDHSAEYFGDIIVSSAYGNYLGRAPDPQGLAYWTDQMQNHGLTDERLEADFISSPEFYARAGGTTKAWVDAVYQDLLGRAADAGGETYWVNQLNAGASRANVAYVFATSAEGESRRVIDDYMHYLGRLPDAAGLNYWVEQLASGVTNEQVITGIVASDEYFNQHTGT